MTKTILIVEDNEMNMKLFNDLLQAHGYNTIQTATGTQAKELALQHSPNLIIMDIQLPDISGAEATKDIKAHDDLSEIPIIAVTAFAMKGDEERIMQSGCDAYMSKPISIADFIGEVQGFIGK
ncbi:response regulator [Terasakiella pusilla]|jgi:two-component system cell cycle response regulator DivK|uniref:response regulator n=1 Tax=Terasakiella pusilla TaxID=64973 RepID=UPI000491BDAA|nr:response regulator [Terasakiella pusilla]